jgi:hypothetical protein
MDMTVSSAKEFLSNPCGNGPRAVLNRLASPSVLVVQAEVPDRRHLTQSACHSESVEKLREIFTLLKVGWEA